MILSCPDCKSDIIVNFEKETIRFKNKDSTFCMCYIGEEDIQEYELNNYDKYEWRYI